MKMKEKPIMCDFYYEWSKTGGKIQKRTSNIHLDRKYSVYEDSVKIEGNKILSDYERVGGISKYGIGNLFYLNKQGEEKPFEGKMDSFIDIVRYNYHIYPAKDCAIEIGENINKFHGLVCDELEKRNIEYVGKRSRIVQFAASKYIAIEKNEFTYLLSYETMYVKNDKVNSCVGKIQYYRYRKNKTINACGQKFTMMYPQDGNTESKEFIDGHKVHNTEYTYLCNRKKVESLVDDFLEFTEENINI